MTKHSRSVTVTALALFAGVFVFTACPPGTDIPPPPDRWAISSPAVNYNAYTGTLTITSASFNAITELAGAVTKVTLGGQSLADGDDLSFPVIENKKTVTIVLGPDSRALVNAAEGFADNGTTTPAQGLKIDAGFAVKGGSYESKELANTAVTVSGYATAFTSAGVKSKSSADGTTDVSATGTVADAAITATILNANQAGEIVLTLGKATGQMVTPGAVTSAGVANGVQTDDTPVVEQTAEVLTPAMTVNIKIDNKTAAVGETYDIVFPVTVTQANCFPRDYTVTITVADAVPISALTVGITAPVAAGTPDTAAPAATAEATFSTITWAGLTGSDFAPGDTPVATFTAAANAGHTFDAASWTSTTGTPLVTVPGAPAGTTIDITYNHSGEVAITVNFPAVDP